MCVCVCVYPLPLESTGVLKATLKVEKAWLSNRDRMYPLLCPQAKTCSHVRFIEMFLTNYMKEILGRGFFQ